MICVVVVVLLGSWSWSRDASRPFLGGLGCGRNGLVLGLAKMVLVKSLLVDHSIISFCVL